MTLETRLSALATAIGQDIKALYAQDGSLAALATSNKTSLAAAINEVLTFAGTRAAAGHTHADATTSVAGFMSGADKSKLDSVAVGATANATDAQLRDRSTHTGTQAFSTITGTVPVGQGGTGITTLTTGNFIRALSASAFEQRTPAQVLGDIGAAAASHTHTASQISDSTAAGRTLLTAVDAPAQRTALGLGNAATSALSTTNAAALGTAAPGSGTTVARADHVHPMPTAAQVGADPAGTGASQAAVAVNARIQAGTLNGRTVVWNTTSLRYEQASNFSFSDTTGALTIASFSPTSQAAVEIGGGRTGDGPSFVDLIGDATYADFGARLIRNGGANGNTDLIHRGTGALGLVAHEAGSIRFAVNGSQRASFNPDGSLSIAATTTFASGPRINAAAGTARRVEYYSSGSIRWQIGATADAESGSNAGTNFNLLRHSDAGAVIDAPLSVNRATGLVTVNSLAIGANQTSAIQAGTVTGRYARWNNTAARWEEFDLLGTPNRWTSGQVFAAVGGAEGGEVTFERPFTDTSFTGNVSVDVAGNEFRVFGLFAGQLRGFRMNFAGGLDGQLLDVLHTGNYATVNTWTATQTFASDNTNLQSGAPRINWIETDATADNGRWRLQANAGVFELFAYNDAGTVFTPVFQVTRTGTTVNTFNVRATNLQVNGNTAWHAGNSAQVQAGTVAGQVPVWNATSNRYEPGTPAGQVPVDTPVNYHSQYISYANAGIV